MKINYNTFQTSLTKEYADSFEVRCAYCVEATPQRPRQQARLYHIEHGPTTAQLDV